MIIQSIKWRLQLWHGFLLVLLVAGLMIGFYDYVRREKIQRIDQELEEAMTFLLPRYAQPGGRRGPEVPPGDPPPPPRRGPENFRPPRDQPETVGEFNPEGPNRANGLPHAQRVHFAVWAEDGRLVASSTNAPAPLVEPRLTQVRPERAHQTRDRFRELVHFVPTGRCLLVGTPLDDLRSDLRNLAIGLVGIGLTIVTLGLTVGWWLVARSLRPITAIGSAAQEIAAGDLSKRINAAETGSELGQLIAVLNSTFARLETAFAQQQQFTSDAAHELRTPVAVILTQVQSTLNKERNGAEYRETLQACQRAAERMKRLIESLLELARFDAGQENLQRHQFDLGAKTQECVDLMQPLAAARDVKILATISPTNCVGDAERLSQVIVNLLTNAVTYNKPDGEVRVSTALRDGSAILTVADTGVGIAPEDAPQVFTRFYRADKSRAGSAGNAGLGLAICKSIVTAHGGTLDFTSQPGHGTTFTVRLPVA